MSVDVQVETTINRSPAEVAAYAGDPGNAPAWYANIRSVDWRTEPPLEVGSRIDFVPSFSVAGWPTPMKWPSGCRGRGS